MRSSCHSTSDQMNPGNVWKRCRVLRCRDATCCFRDEARNRHTTPSAAREIYRTNRSHIYCQLPKDELQRCVS